MARFQITVSFKNGIFDPAGATALKHLKKDYEGLEGIEVGKSIIVEGDVSIDDVRAMCDATLVNPVLEDYVVEALDELGGK